MALKGNYNCSLKAAQSGTIHPPAQRLNEAKLPTWSLSLSNLIPGRGQKACFLQAGWPRRGGWGKAEVRSPVLLPKSTVKELSPSPWGEINVRIQGWEYLDKNISSYTETVMKVSLPPKSIIRKLKFIMELKNPNPRVQHWHRTKASNV